MPGEGLLDLDLVPKVQSARNLIRTEWEKLKSKEERFSSEDVREIFIEPEHSNIRNAILADTLDMVPIIGDVSNVIRVIKIREDLGLFEKGQKRREERFKQALNSGSFTGVKEVVKDSINEAVDEVREFQKKRGGMQSLDAVAGFIPSLGFLADTITPTNTVNYLAKRG